MKIVLCEKSVQPMTRRQNFRLAQIETNCRRHFKMHEKRKICAIKHCEKRRNCLLQAISPFLTMFSTALFSVRQNKALCGNGLIHLQRILALASLGSPRMLTKAKTFCFR